MYFGFSGVYVEDIQGRLQGDSYHSLSVTGRGVLLGFWLRPLSSTVCQVLKSPVKNNTKISNTFHK